MRRRYNKYGNRKVIVNGEKYDSQKEATRHLCLRLRQNGGEIEGLERQPKFLLQDTFKDSDGITERKITYTADFKYFDKKLNVWIVEDVKGFKTDVYLLKKKLFKKKYPDYKFVET